ncbi:hypothetical protein FFWV33_18410 [Flavobacterium faecale]|uniref:DUF808 domain-containing protein n=1 Tax=Flavobacterium faecale TaxID=1355330 RepID=A0A2S1LJP2_9FLAO|nr:DUF808 domain-containing protein [Flavobacterium faecale]AWG23716.1 hypothetical protein FFWV33_18410 [Flavobacterium faecale]
MASGLFLLLDDIAALMDDVVVMSKIATKKTAGILGDDLAVNAEKASGFVSSREIPVLWAITKGSLLNKLIILPFAFILSYFLPDSITIILSLGAVYLAYEGVEKIYEYIVPHHHAETSTTTIALSETEILALEKDKIKSAIITDFILSIEIVIIALGTVLEKDIATQIMVVSFIAVLATVGVYGIVAMIVRMDDFGMFLSKKSSGALKFIGTILIKALPLVIKSSAIIGTIALLLVSGGIFKHNIAYFHHFLETLPAMASEFFLGLAVGIVALIVISAVQWAWKKVKS